MAAVLAAFGYWLYLRSDKKREQQMLREKRQHELDIAEQLTYQLDQAKGNPELLALISEKLPTAYTRRP